MVAFRAVTKAMDTAKAIAESEKIDATLKPGLTAQVLQTGSSTQQFWDNWAQRLVAGGLALIGLSLTIFVGVAMLEGNAIDPAVPTALSGAIGGLAGMFTTKALNGNGTNGNGTSGAGTSGNAAGSQRPTSGTATRPRGRAV